MTMETAVQALAQAVGADVKTINQKVATTRATGYDDLVVNSAATGTVACNLNLATVFDLTLTGNATITFSNVPTPTGQMFSWVVAVTMGGTLRTLAFTGVTWRTASGTFKTPAVGKVQEYIFSTTNGTTIIGREGAST